MVHVLHDPFLTGSRLLRYAGNSLMFSIPFITATDELFHYKILPLNIFYEGHPIILSEKAMRISRSFGSLILILIYRRMCQGDLIHNASTLYLFRRVTIFVLPKGVKLIFKGLISYLIKQRVPRTVSTLLRILYSLSLHLWLFFFFLESFIVLYFVSVAL